MLYSLSLSLSRLAGVRRLVAIRVVLSIYVISFHSMYVCIYIYVFMGVSFSCCFPFFRSRGGTSSPRPTRPEER